MVAALICLEANMAKLKYVGEFPEGAEEITQYGYVFQGDKPVEVKDDDLARFAGNRFFVDVASGRGKADKE